MHRAMRSLGWLAFALAGLAVALTSGRASAWCRTTTKLDFVPTDAVPCDVAGKPVFWASRCAEIHVARRGSVQVDLATARKIVAQSFAAWATVDCPDDPVACGTGSKGAPSIVVTEAGATDCGAGYVRSGANVNAVVFHDDEWPHPDPGTVIALTTVTFRVDSGAIVDADIEIDSNPTRHPLSTTTPSTSQYDLLSVITHEAGHFLGLAHTPVAMATMTPRYESGDTFLRDLERDDVCGICAAAPPGRDAQCTGATAQTCGAGTSDAAPTADAGTTTPGAETECDCATPGRGRPPAILTFLPAVLVLSRLRRRTAAASRTRPRSCS